MAASAGRLELRRLMGEWAHQAKRHCEQLGCACSGQHQGEGCRRATSGWVLRHFLLEVTMFARRDASLGRGQEGRANAACCADDHHTCGALGRFSTIFRTESKLRLCMCLRLMIWGFTVRRLPPACAPMPLLAAAMHVRACCRCLLPQLLLPSRAAYVTAMF